MPQPHQTKENRAIPSSYILAGIIFLVVVLFFATGTLLGANDSDDEEINVERPLFTVLVQDTVAASRNIEVTVAGRTEAGKRVIVRAETPGQIVKTAKEGARVAAGALLCQLGTDSRNATLAEAQAGAAKADADFEGAKRLYSEGFASEAALRTARAARDAARARLSQATIDLNNVDIRAPFAGQVAKVIVEPGDVIATGGACAELADLGDIVIAGGVAATQATQLTVGDQAQITIAGNPQLPATVTFVAEVADDQTRAFRVELELDDANGIASGLNARAIVTAGAADTIFVPRNALVFDDAGTLGIRALTEIKDGGTGKVTFFPVVLVSESNNGIYVSGLPSGVPIIVRGQEFVSAGSRVAFQPSDGNVGG